MQSIHRRFCGLILAVPGLAIASNLATASNRPVASNLSVAAATEGGNCRLEVLLCGQIETFWRTGFDSWQGEGPLVCNDRTVALVKVTYDDDVAGGYGATANSQFLLKVFNILENTPSLLQGRFQSNGGRPWPQSQASSLVLDFPSPRDSWLVTLSWESWSNWGVRAFQRAGRFSFEMTSTRPKMPPTKDDRP